MRLRDKTAVVVGSTYGIGKSIALLFAREGAKVVVSGRTKAKGDEVVQEIRAAGGEVCFLPCDAGEPAQIERLMQGAFERYGAIDVLVCNAFALNPLKPMAELTREEWQRVIDVTLTGTFLCCKQAIPFMERAGGGSIINIGSVGATLAFQLHSAYNAAKAGVANLTRAIALDYGTKGIRANLVCPGIINTPHTRHELANPKTVEEFLAKLAIKRIGTGDDVAHAALYLASEESSYVTGSVLYVDGGWTAVGNTEEKPYEF